MQLHRLIIQRNDVTRRLLVELDLNFRVSRINPRVFVIEFDGEDIMAAYRHDMLSGLGCIVTQLDH